MRIQHNITAMNAYRNYNNNTSAIGKNLEKLSSGYKINRAGDDAAGLAVSQKMRLQIAGLSQAQKNAKSGISYVQTAEGALQEVHEMLERMYTLAEQSANGTFDSSTDRTQLQKEVNNLMEEINRIGKTANFNGMGIFSQYEGGASPFKGGDATEETKDSGGITTMTDWSAGTAVTLASVKGTFTIDVGGTTYSVLVTTATTDAVKASADAGEAVIISTSSAVNTKETAKQITDQIVAAVKKQVAADQAEAKKGTTDYTQISGLKIEVNGDDPTKLTASYKKKTMEYDSEAAAAAPAAGKIDFWIGAENIGDGANKLTIQTMSLVVDDISIEDAEYDNVGVDLSGKVASGDISGVDITDASTAMDALNTIKAASDSVSNMRGTLGAMQNRLDHTLKNLSVMQENMQDAESVIRDTDVAEEMMAYTKNNILVQSAQAMLAQANQIPQGVLQLLG